jgi:hypothetical protein
MRAAIVLTDALPRIKPTDRMRQRTAVVGQFAATSRGVAAERGRTYDSWASESVASHLSSVRVWALTGPRRYVKLYCVNPSTDCHVPLDAAAAAAAAASGGITLT